MVLDSRAAFHPQLGHKHHLPTLILQLLPQRAVVHPLLPLQILQYHLFVVRAIFVDVGRDALCAVEAAVLRIADVFQTVTSQLLVLQLHFSLEQFIQYFYFAEGCAFEVGLGLNPSLVLAVSSDRICARPVGLLSERVYALLASFVGAVMFEFNGKFLPALDHRWKLVFFDIFFNNLPWDDKQVAVVRSADS